MQKHVGNLLLLLAVGIVVFGLGIGKRDLWAPDEPRFGLVTRTMLETREPFVMYLEGEAYTDKPPLLIWMASLLTLAGSWQPGDEISSFAVRAPSVLGGLIGLWATYALGCSLFGSRRAALLSSIALATTFMYCYQACRAQMDSLMAGWSCLAALAFWLADRAERPNRRLLWWALFWIAGGLATLSKGPPGLIVPLGAAAFYLMCERNARAMWWTAGAWFVGVLGLTILARFEFMQGMAFPVLVLLTLAALLVQAFALWFVPLYRERGAAALIRTTLLFLAGAALCAAVVGIWFIPYRLRAPAEASSDTLVTQTLTRYLAGISHLAPLHYFVVRLPHNLLPWSLFLIPAVLAAFRSQEAMERRPRRFLAAWALFTLCFFSLSPGKRDQYLLPSLAAYALFCGWFFDRMLRVGLRDSVRSLTVPGYVNAALAGLLAIGSLLASLVFLTPVGDWVGLPRLLTEHDVPADSEVLSTLPFWPLSVLMGAGCVLLWWSVRRRQVLWVFTGSALLLGGLNVYLNTTLLPHIDPLKSGRMLSEKIMEWHEGTAPVGIFGFYRAEYELYGDYRLQRIHQDEKAGDPALHEFLRENAAPLYILFRDDDFEKTVERYPDLGLDLVERLTIGSRQLTVARTAPAPDKK